MKPDKRLEVRLSMEVFEVKEGEEKPFYDCELNYHDFPYEALVEVQEVLAKALNELVEHGRNRIR